MPDKVHIYNTLTRKTEPLEPLRPGHVGIYTCGPTVYSYAHIGNMRSFLFADILRRTLRLAGYQVHQVMNITDVGHLTDDADEGEEKLEVGARREGATVWDIAKKYTDAYFEHADMLNIERPEVTPKATDHIAQQIRMVQALEEKGYTYQTEDGVYFDTSRFSHYSELGRLDVEGLREGHRVESGGKRHKTDFALWKFSKPEEKRAMEWDSPWGKGFPGWHIECSAMSMEYLGDQFDIHTGGVDHIPIHHTNEIAQSECATGRRPFVRYWMHGEFLVVDDAPKMSKSKGNIITVSSLAEEGFDPLAYRTLCLQTHYRKQLRFNRDVLAGAARSDERLVQHAAELREQAEGESVTLSAKGDTYESKFREAVFNDLNTPQALANLWTLLDDEALGAAEKYELLKRHDQVLGLRLEERAQREESVPNEILSMLEQRTEARKSKNFSEADRLRDEITSRGYEILDGPEGSRVKKKLV